MYVLLLLLYPVFYKLFLKLYKNDKLGYTLSILY